MIKVFYPLIILGVLYLLYFILQGENKDYPMFIIGLLFYPLLFLQLFLVVPIIYKKMKEYGNKRV